MYSYRVNVNISHNCKFMSSKCEFIYLTMWQSISQLWTYFSYLHLHNAQHDFKCCGLTLSYFTIILLFFTLSQKWASIASRPMVLTLKGLDSHFATSFDLWCLSMKESALNVVPLRDGIDATQWVITGHLPLRLLIVILPKSWQQSLHGIWSMTSFSIS